MVFRPTLWSVLEFQIGKLEKANKKENEDLRDFEHLEEAVQDSSFCSTSSTVKNLMKNVVMPSPIPKRSDSHTSTPKSKSKTKPNKEGSNSLFQNEFYKYFSFTIEFDFSAIKKLASGWHTIPKTVLGLHFWPY